MPEELKSLKGQLLLDGGKLRGSFFHRTVVLICQHDSEGAFGLVLNRSSGNKVGDMLVADLPDAVKDQTLFVGGPVQPAALSYLHTDVFVPHANVMNNLNLGHSLEGLVDLAESYSTTQKIRLFAGYAGWTGGQLEDEMKRGAWLSHPATVDVIFEAEVENLWKSVLKRKGWQYRLLADSPEDLAWN